MGLRKKVQRIFENSGRKAGAIWRWAKNPRNRDRRHERWSAAVWFADFMRRHSKPGSKARKKWAERQGIYEKREKATEPKDAPARAVVSRSDWGAPALSPFPGNMGTPTNGVFIHHSVANAPTTESGEKAEMRNLDAIARARGFNGISYSFVVFPSGRIYEGRGKGVVGAHTAGFNSTSYGICGAGNYDTTPPTDAMVASMRWLRRDHLDLADRPVRPHRSVFSTACPGRHLLARIGEL